MRVTDPNATKWISHPSDTAAEFEISAAMPASERMRLSTEIQKLGPKDGVVDILSYQKFYEGIVKKHLRAVRGVEDASGNPLDFSNVDKAVSLLSEIRLPDFDNVTLWLGNEIFNLNVLNEEEKKRSKSALNTRNGEEPTT